MIYHIYYFIRHLTLINAYILDLLFCVSILLFCTFMHMQDFTSFECSLAVGFSGVTNVTSPGQQSADGSSTGMFYIKTAQPAQCVIQDRSNYGQ